MSDDLRWHYDHDPSTSDRDAVRFLVGDINSKRKLLDDREIEWAIANNPDLNIASAVLCEHLFGRFAGMSDIKVGPVSKSFSKVAELYKKKAAQLRAEACLTAAPSFPAIERASKEALELDTSLTDPSFSLGLGDNPFAIQINSGLNGTRFDGF